jgi:hypothetical protein
VLDNIILLRKRPAQQQHPPNFSRPRQDVPAHLTSMVVQAILPASEREQPLGNGRRRVMGPRGPARVCG